MRIGEPFPCRIQDQKIRNRTAAKKIPRTECTSEFGKCPRPHNCNHARYFLELKDGKFWDANAPYRSHGSNRTHGIPKNGPKYVVNRYDGTFANSLRTPEERAASRRRHEGDRFWSSSGMHRTRSHHHPFASMPNLPAYASAPHSPGHHSFNPSSNRHPSTSRPPNHQAGVR